MATVNAQGQKHLSWSSKKVYPASQPLKPSATVHLVTVLGPACGGKRASY
jgi:hypothetical protein